jgi:hypothetical protein
VLCDREAKVPSLFKLILMAKKKEPFHFEFYIPIHLYGIMVDVYVSEDEDRLTRIDNILHDKHSVTDEKTDKFGVAGRVYPIFSDPKSGFGLVSILFSYQHYKPGVIAHEVFHAVCEICRRVGIDYSYSSEEAFAYLIGYLTDQITHATEKALIDGIKRNYKNT